MAQRWNYTKGLKDLGNGLHAWLQPDGGWGWSNAGLITDGDQSLLVDTLFDMHLTADMLKAMQDATGLKPRDIGTIVNTHANGDHCLGDQLSRNGRSAARHARTVQAGRCPARPRRCLFRRHLRALRLRSGG